MNVTNLSSKGEQSIEKEEKREKEKMRRRLSKDTHNSEQSEELERTSDHALNETLLNELRTLLYQTRTNIRPEGKGLAKTRNH